MVTRPRACFLAGGKLRQLFLPHFSSFLLNAAEPTQVDGNRRCRSVNAGVHIRTSRQSGRGPAQTQMRRPALPVMAQGRLRYGRALAGRPGNALNRSRTCQP